MTKKEESTSEDKWWEWALAIAVMAFAAVGVVTTILFCIGQWQDHHDAVVEADQSALQAADHDSFVEGYFRQNPDCATANFADLRNVQCVIGKTTIADLTDRLTAIDSGKVKKWACEKSADDNFHLVTDPTSGMQYYTMQDATTTVVVQTVGTYETPQKLGYTNCSAIPANLYDVVPDAVNK